MFPAGFAEVRSCALKHARGLSQEGYLKQAPAHSLRPVACGLSVFLCKSCAKSRIRRRRKPVSSDFTTAYEFGV